MTRRAVATLATMILLISVPSVALGAQPSIYHSISVTSASAAFSVTDGCLQTDVWVSSTDGQWASQPGPVNKQGLTSVAIRVTDACARITAAAGGGSPPIFDGFGQNLVPLVGTPQLTAARVSTTLPVEDSVSGDTLTVSIDVDWAAAGQLDRSPVRSHVRFPGEGVVNSHDNNLFRPAMAVASVSIDGQLVALDPTWDATMERVKSGCMEISWPHFDGFTKWCFGF